MRAIFFCREAVTLASNALDRRLPINQRIQMHLHMMVCPACRAYRRQISELDLLVIKHLRDGAPMAGEGLSSEERGRMAEQLRQQLG